MQPMNIDSRPAGAADAPANPAASSLVSFQALSHEISEKEFLRLRNLVYEEAGLWLSQAKTALLVGRLAKRLRHHGLKSFKQYYDLVINSPEERIQMLDALSTNETRFFREPQHFELLKSVILPKWTEEAATGHRGRKIRVLSAGCSTGQEPYSLAMVLLDRFPGWEIEIIATDLSTRALEIARTGIWPATKVNEIPSSYLKAFMLKGFADQAGKVRAGPEIRSIVRFFRMNLNEPAYPLTGKFEMIFCRNVLIYFDQRGRERVVRRLASFLSPDGYLFLGHAESLHAMSDRLRSIIPTVYVGRDDAIDDAKP
ncbi:MAG TPA: protein-glutamate O-methyltransferase CheR [Candidatus Angelobacter sp.]|jgi:chemotaxis protein methyltransferase CheR